MAAHLRSNIRLYVTGNRFVSPSFSPLSGGARPLMAGARSLCSSNISASPNQVSKPTLENYAQDFFTFSLMFGLVFTLFQCADVGRGRSRYERQKFESEREISFLVEADLKKYQRRIEEMKKTCGRVDKNENVAA